MGVRKTRLSGCAIPTPPPQQSAHRSPFSNKGLKGKATKGILTYKQKCLSQMPIIGVIQESYILSSHRKLTTTRERIRKSYHKPSQNRENRNPFVVKGSWNDLLWCGGLLSGIGLDLKTKKSHRSVWLDGKQNSAMRSNVLHSEKFFLSCM